MSWDEEFASRYDEWSAYMTADVALYIDLALEADGPVVELAIGNGRVAIPVAQASRQRVIGIDSSPAMLEQARARAVEAGVELDLHQGDMRDLDEPAALIYCPTGHYCTCRPGPTAAGPLSASRPHFSREGGSPGMHSHSTTGSRRASTASTRMSRFRTRSDTQPATTGSTSSSTVAEGARSGGLPKTSGLDSSTWPDLSWKHFMGLPRRAVHRCESGIRVCGPPLCGASSEVNVPLKRS